MKQFIEIMAGNRVYAFSKPITHVIDGIEHVRDTAFYKNEFDLKKTINVNHIKEFGEGFIGMSDGETHRVNMSYDEIKELIINPDF